MLCAIRHNPPTPFTIGFPVGITKSLPVDSIPPNLIGYKLFDKYGCGLVFLTGLMAVRHELPNHHRRRR